MRTASFRGVTFDWIEAPLTFGRETADHRYPDKVNKNGVVTESRSAYIEDPTAKIRVIHMIAVYIGPDCETQAGELRNMCDRPGPGKLVHPTLGEMDAICESGSLDVNQETFVARLDLSFKETGFADLKADKSTISIAEDASARALADALAYAQAAWNMAQAIAGAPAAILDSISAGMRQAQALVKSIASPALASQLKGRIGALGMQVGSLAATPEDLADQWSAVFEGLSPADIARMASALGATTSPLTPAGAYQDLLSTATVATACRAAVANPGESDFDARTLGRRLTAAILASAALASTPEHRAGLIGMAAATATALDEIAGSMPRLRVINLVRATPLLCLVADLCPGQDPERAALAILRRNPTCNALFMPAGRLEVVNA